MEKTSEDVVWPSRESSGSDAESLLWRQFAEATTPKAFCQSWLPLQCRMLKGVRCAMALLGPADRGPFTPVAVWPDSRINMNHLTGAAERALKERRGLLLEGDSTPVDENSFPQSYHVAYPVEVSGKLHGVVVLEVEQYPRDEVQAILRNLHWGAAWLEILIRRTEDAKSQEVSDRLRRVLGWVTSTVEHPSFRASAMAFVTRLATDLGCDRVSLGIMKGKHAKVSALSHSAEFGKQTNLMRAIGAAMDEAMDQHAVVVYPQSMDAPPLVMRSHEELSQKHGSGAILTIPLEHKDKSIGGLTLERPEGRPFDMDTVEICETVAALGGPILDTKRLEDRLIIRKAADSFVLQMERLLGPGHLLRKMIVIGMIAMVLFFVLFKIDYRVTGETTIEGTIQRVIAAPFNGYIKEAPARPGDLVKEGALLCRLDDRDLKLERLKWATEREQSSRQHDEAMAKHDRAQNRIMKAKMDQAEAQIALLDEQLTRTKVMAPFDGVVMSGDLSQSLGAPVERGQVLYEVAPLHEYRVIAQVDERDVMEIRVGQKSNLILPSMPGQEFPFIVDKITPVSTAKEGRNYFRVEGHLEKPSERLRPGMEGIAKITIDRRKLIWVWTHEAIDWIRLQVWRWMP
jgi:RND family efflux transporter MFP subunit